MKKATGNGIKNDLPTTYIKNSGLSTRYKVGYVNLSSVINRKVST